MHHIPGGLVRGGRTPAGPVGGAAGAASAAGTARRGLRCDDGAVTPRLLPPAVPVTSLRVYEPAATFSADAHRRWARCLVSAEANVRAEEAERGRSWRQLVRGPARSVLPAGEVAAEDDASPAPAGPRSPAQDLSEFVRVLRVEGGVLLCPVEPWGAGPRRSLVRAWELPIPWLVLATDRERGQAQTPGLYRVPMARARARAARALRALRQGLDGAEVTAEVEVVARWLESFHPRSWVELDTRSVAALVGTEDGVDDVRLGLECLSEHDVTGLAAAYQRLRRRSARLEQISRCS